MTKLAEQEKKPEDPKGNFPKAHKEVNYIFSGPNSYEPKRKQKLIVLAVDPTTSSTLDGLSSPLPLTVATT
jgi:hypothetical protein